MRFSLTALQHSSAFLTWSLASLAINACSTPAHLPASQATLPPASTNLTPSSKPLKTPPAPSTVTSLTSVAQTKTQAKIAMKAHQIQHQGITFHLVCFDTRDYELQVADQPGGPGSIWSSAQSVANKHKAAAAINAGFFTPEGKPLGLVIENGIQRGHYNASSLGKGIYYTTATGAKIKRSNHWRSILQAKPKHLLQAGPMLVEKGVSTRGLSAKSSRPRSFIATDGKNHWLIGHADSCTLSRLGAALSSIKIPDFELLTALNLDGGRSSDLFVDTNVENGPLDIRPFWNKPVRNFLILKKK